MCTSSVLQRAHAEPYPERPGQRERLLLSPACSRKARAGFYTPVSSSPACWSSEVYRNKWERTFYPLFRWSFVFLACVCRKKLNKKAHTYHPYTSAVAGLCCICWESCRLWRRAVECWHTWGWIWGMSQPRELWKSSLARSYGRWRQCPIKKQVNI